jgi:crotonobetainyl-CoA:carnitine CoA-transferase CaiB-like acyl-CoA transferase
MLGDAPMAAAHGAPRLGEHSAEILREIGEEP